MLYIVQNIQIEFMNFLVISAVRASTSISY